MDTERRRAMPATIEELETIIDARIEADRQGRLAGCFGAWSGYDPTEDVIVATDDGRTALLTASLEPVEREA